VYAFFFALAMNLASYWFSDKIVVKMHRAQELSRNRIPAYDRDILYMAPLYPAG